MLTVVLFPNSSLFKTSLPNELNYDKEFNLFSQKFKILMTNKEIN